MWVYEYARICCSSWYLPSCPFPPFLSFSTPTSPIPLLFYNFSKADYQRILLSITLTGNILSVHIMLMKLYIFSLMLSNLSIFIKKHDIHIILLQKIRLNNNSKFHISIKVSYLSLRPYPKIGIFILNFHPQILRIVSNALNTFRNNKFVVPDSIYKVTSCIIPMWSDVNSWSLFFLFRKFLKSGVFKIIDGSPDFSKRVMKPIFKAVGNAPELRNLRNKINRYQEITSLHLYKKSPYMPSGTSDLLLRKVFNELLTSSRVKNE